jgi:hypothetical protein
MRTNTAILGAAAFAVGALSSATAQNVYSVNVVGYVNVVYPHGYSIQVNPLLNSNNSISNLFAAASTATTALGNTYYGWGGTGFVNVQVNDSYNSWSNPTFQVNPGTGYLWFNPGNAWTNTFVGSVVQGSTNVVGNGYSLQGSQWPVQDFIQNLGLDAQGPLVVGTVVTNTTAGSGDRLYFLNNGSFVSFTKDSYGLNWSPNNAVIPCDPVKGPQVAVGQGFFYLNLSGSPKSWPQTFTVQ